MSGHECFTDNVSAEQRENWEQQKQDSNNNNKSCGVVLPSIISRWRSPEAGDSVTLGSKFHDLKSPFQSSNAAETSHHCTCACGDSTCCGSRTVASSGSSRFKRNVLSQKVSSDCSWTPSKAMTKSNTRGDIGLPIASTMRPVDNNEYTLHTVTAAASSSLNREFRWEPRSVKNRAKETEAFDLAAGRRSEPSVLSPEYRNGKIAGETSSSASTTLRCSHATFNTSSPPYSRSKNGFIFCSCDFCRGSCTCYKTGLSHDSPFSYTGKDRQLSPQESSLLDPPTGPEMKVIRNTERESRSLQYSRRRSFLSFLSLNRPSCPSPHFPQSTQQNFELSSMKSGDNDNPNFESNVTFAKSSPKNISRGRFSNESTSELSPHPVRSLNKIGGKSTPVEKSEKDSKEEKPLESAHPRKKLSFSSFLKSHSASSLISRFSRLKLVDSTPPSSSSPNLMSTPQAKQNQSSSPIPLRGNKSAPNNPRRCTPSNYSNTHFCQSQDFKLLNNSIDSPVLNHRRKQFFTSRHSPSQINHCLQHSPHSSRFNADSSSITHPSVNFTPHCRNQLLIKSERVLQPSNFRHHRHLTDQREKGAKQIKEISAVSNNEQKLSASHNENCIPFNTNVREEKSDKSENHGKCVAPHHFAKSLSGIHGISIRNSSGAISARRHNNRIIQSNPGEGSRLSQRETSLNKRRYCEKNKKDSINNSRISTSTRQWSQMRSPLEVGQRWRHSEKSSQRQAGSRRQSYKNNSIYANEIPSVNFVKGRIIENNQDQQSLRRKRTLYDDQTRDLLRVGVRDSEAEESGFNTAFESKRFPYSRISDSDEQDRKSYSQEYARKKLTQKYADQLYYKDTSEFTKSRYIPRIPLRRLPTLLEVESPHRRTPTGDLPFHSSQPSRYSPQRKHFKQAFDIIHKETKENQNRKVNQDVQENKKTKKEESVTCLKIPIRKSVQTSNNSLQTRALLSPNHNPTTNKQSQENRTPYSQFTKNIHRHSTRNKKILELKELKENDDDLESIRLEITRKLTSGHIGSERKEEDLPLPVLSIAVSRSNLELELISYGYEHQRILSFGSAGCAHVIRSINDCDLWVAKVIDITRLSKEEIELATLEVEYLKRLKHPFILRFKESFITTASIIIITEYCEGGDLFSRIQKAATEEFSQSDSDNHTMKSEECSTNRSYKWDNTITPHQIVQWITQLALGLQYMHSQKILHCDLKTSNIFLTKDGTAKIGDLGIARELKQEEGTVTPHRCPRGTLIYMSPELCNGKELSDKADSWALGCLLYELVFKKHAFANTSITAKRSLSSRVWTMSSTVEGISLEIDRRIPEIENEIKRFGDLAKKYSETDEVKNQTDIITNGGKIKSKNEFDSPWSEESDIWVDQSLSPKPCSQSLFTSSPKKLTFDKFISSQNFCSSEKRRRRRSFTECRTERQSKRMRLLTGPTVRHSRSSEYRLDSQNASPIRDLSYISHQPFIGTDDDNTDECDNQEWIAAESPSRSIADFLVSSSSSGKEAADDDDAGYSLGFLPRNTISDNSSNLFSMRLIHHLLGSLLEPEPEKRPALHEVLEMLYSAEYLPDDDESPINQIDTWSGEDEKENQADTENIPATEDMKQSTKDELNQSGSSPFIDFVTVERILAKSSYNTVNPAVFHLEDHEPKSSLSSIQCSVDILLNNGQPISAITTQDSEEQSRETQQSLCSQSSTLVGQSGSRLNLRVPLCRATKGVVSPQLRAVARYLHQLPNKQVHLIRRQPVDHRNK